MFVWAAIPQEHGHLNSFDFAMKILNDAEVCVSPGAGFGHNGENYIRIALVENSDRIRQAVRQIRRALF
jgi:alanine-synthesizing transaminase